jgi:surface protein
MAFMFSMADVFNQAIGDWNVSNVTNMKGMFSKALEFNQSITNWNIDRLTDDPQYLYEF